MRRRKLLSITIISLLLGLSTGCNRKAVLQADPNVGEQAQSQTISSSSTQNMAQDINNISGETNLNPENYAPANTVQTTPVNVNPNQFVKKLRVDHDVLNQWQATGVVAAGGTVYFTAVDTDGLFSKGTVIKVSPDGNGWTDLGGSLLSLRHSMSAGLTGITYINGSLLAIDSQQYVYKVTGSKVTKMEYTGGKDITTAGSSVFIVNNSGLIEKTDENLSSKILLRGVSATGGIGGDLAGNLYIINNKEVIKVDSMGNIMPVITTNLENPVDVTADSLGNIYVLEGSYFKRFDSNGNYLVTVPVQGTKQNSIHADESGKVYISSYGTNFKDSSVEIFSAGEFHKPVTPAQNMNYNNYQAPVQNNQPYNSYAQLQQKR